MSNENDNKPEAAETSTLLKAVTSIFITLLVIGGLLFGAIFALTPVGQTAGQWVSWFFGLNSIQLWWYVTRASGLVAYLLLWFSMVLGLAVSSKYLDHLLDRVFTYDFHQFISLLSIAFILVHVIVLMVDRYLPYTIWQVIIPFISPYRPFWVGVGVLSFYLIILVTVTFYIKKKIGMKSFRVIHYLSLLAYLGATLHGIYSGTDTPLSMVQLLYKGTGLAVLFLTIFWLVLAGLRKVERKQKEQAAAQLATAKRHVTNH
jgi:predicted ferric reductase